MLRFMITDNKHVKQKVVKIRASKNDGYQFNVI